MACTRTKETTASTAIATKTQARGNRCMDPPEGTRILPPFCYTALPMSTDTRWADVDAYVNGVLAPDDPALHAAMQASEAAGLPPISVTPLQGRLLHVMARAIRSRAI